MARLYRIIISNDLLDGFTSEKGCQKALLMLSCIVDHFDSRGSSVYVAG